MTENISPTVIDGYRTDLTYTFGLHQSLNPDEIFLKLLLLGLNPPKSFLLDGDSDDRCLSYCELGSGQGITLNFLAARDPGGHYVGIDYNSSQIEFYLLIILSILYCIKKCTNEYSQIFFFNVKHMIKIPNLVKKHQDI